jgi:hypothetical protein
VGEAGAGSGSREQLSGRVRPGRRTRGQQQLFVLAGALLLCGALLSLCCPAAGALPDNRSYELVTRFEEGGLEIGLNGVEPGIGLPSISGDALDWRGMGACCGASSGASNLYQSERRANGWQTRVLTPTPSEGLDGIFEQQAPMFFTDDLQQTIWLTPGSYAPGDHRPKSSDKNDLYLQGPTGALTWLSQGPSGTGSGRDGAELDGATPAASEVVFSTAEQLTADATGLAPLHVPLQYLYARNVADETTNLLDVNDNGELISAYGAVLGNGYSLAERLNPTDEQGTATNAISADGTKVFFEAPIAHRVELPAGQVPHLYMRDLERDTTTALDNPAASDGAQYEGASADGSLVFFTSAEGLDGAPTATELYEFNTTASAIGPAAPMSAVPITSGAGGILGISAIANDGSRVYYVADEVLADNPNPLERSAVAGQPNLYAYDTKSGVTTFVATLAPPDVNTCLSTCAGEGPSGLVAEPDIVRPAYPTPNGEVLVFASRGDVTGQDTAPATRITAPVTTDAHILLVESTTGFLVHGRVAIATGTSEELATIEAIDSPTEVTLEGGLTLAHPAGAAVAELHAELYRYSSGESSLVCVSCTAPGVIPTASASAAASGGGSYAPQGQTAPMSEDGTRIFFQSPDPLVPEAPTPSPSASYEPTDVYEWENGHVSLIANASTGGATFDGTTPNGDDAFFATRAQLLPGEDGGADAIYDARVDGGFPTPAPKRAPCSGADCRSPDGSTVFFPVPESATLSGVSAFMEHGLATPTYAIATITPAQRSRLARVGILTLTVTASAAGRLAASLSADVHHRSQRVAGTDAILTRSGTAELTLHLNRAARSQLARRRTLTLRLEVRYSASSTVKRAQLTLRAQSSDPAAAGSHSHRA